MYFIERNWPGEYAKFSRKKVNKEWLEKNFFAIEHEKSDKVGRPSKSYLECCPKSKKNKIKNCQSLLDKSFSPSTISGFIEEKLPAQSAKKLNFDLSQDLKIQANMSKIQYENVRSTLKENLEILSYKQLSRNSKKNLENVPFIISENCIGVDVRFLVTETFEKLLLKVVYRFLSQTMSFLF